MTRVGLVGCGFMGKMHASVYKLLDGVETTVCMDRNSSRANQFSESFGVPTCESLEAMLSDNSLHIVDICLPTYLHAEFSISALDAGKDVICEKPMALNLKDADMMLEAAERNGKYLMIGHCIRFWPEYVYLEDLVKSKKFGELLSLNLTRYGEFPHWSSDNWMEDPMKSGGGVLDMHIHDSDFALHLLGEPISVCSWGTIDSRGPSHAFTTLEYPKTIVHVEGGWNLPPHTPFCMSFRAIFEHGALIFERGVLTAYEQNGEPFSPEFESLKAEGGGNISDLGGYYHELKYFVDCVRDRKPPQVATAQSSRASLALVLEEIAQIRARMQDGTTGASN